MAVLKVYGSVFSTSTMRVLACLYEKELEFELIHVDMRAKEHKTPSYLSLNPFGKVPALEDGDLKLFESRAITAHIAHSDFERGTCLVYPGPKMALVGVWLEVESQHFDPKASKLTWELFYKPMFGADTDAVNLVEEYEAELAKVLDIYEARLAESKYLGGNDYSLADLHHLPNIHYLMGTPAKKLFESRPHVSTWCATILARPAWLKVVAMQKPVKA